MAKHHEVNMWQKRFVPFMAAGEQKDSTKKD
jgi:hypothetical protein